LFVCLWNVWLIDWLIVKCVIDWNLNRILECQDY
jgi:hypothetical protein